MRRPKKVKLILHNGVDLSYRVPGSHQNAKTRHWLAKFLGGEQTLATSSVPHDQGNPIWNCEVIMDMINPVDPVVIIVVDGKKREVGQVVIPIERVPCREITPLEPKYLVHTDLEATRKNSYPQGRISYWIGVMEYWPADQNLDPASYKTKSLRKSLSNLSTTLFHKHHRTDEQSGISTTSKIKQKLHAIKGNKYDKRSNLNGGASNKRISRQPSNLSAHSMGDIRHSNGPVGGVLSPTSSINSGTRPLGWHSTLGSQRRQTVNSYNPFDADADDDYGSKMAANPNGASTIDVRQAGVDEPPGNYGTHKPKILSKMKQKLTKSTHNLSELGHRITGRGSSKHSDIGDQHPRKSLQVDRPHRDDIDDDDMIDPNRKSPRNAAGFDSSTMPDFTRGRTSQNQAENTGRVSSTFGGEFEPEHKRYLSDASDTLFLDGLKPPKPTSDMNRRELIEYANRIESQNTSYQTDLSNMKKDNERLHTELSNANATLNQVRTQLLNLRNQLLRDGLTEYLEVEPVNKSNHIKADKISFGADNTDGNGEKRGLSAIQNNSMGKFPPSDSRYLPDGGADNEDTKSGIHAGWW